MKNKFETHQIMTEVNALLMNPVILEKAYGLGMTQSELKSIGHELVPYLKAIKERMQPISQQNHKNNNKKMQITNVQDIEDCYWSPKYGLKGKVDCTVETIDNFGKKSVIPMEFKTGRPKNAGDTKKTDVRSEHVGQVFLYSLMMDKIHLVGPNGVLHYIRYCIFFI